jgi:uncharacterized protein
MQADSKISRRGMLLGSASAGAAVLAGIPAGQTLSASVERTPVIDCHAHLYHPSRADYLEANERLIDAADRLGIDRLCCSILTPKRPATVEGFRECNRALVQAIRRHPERIWGYCYVNPGFSREAVDEIRRYVLDHEFMGVKLYNEHVCTEPVVAPVVETAIELQVPILHHAGRIHHPFPEQPNISDGGHLAELGQRYPEVRLICAHIGGGGDWEWTIKALRHAANVYLDTSGSVTDEGMIELAARTVGVDRLLFGCDMSMTAGVGKIRSADLAAEDKRKILGGNLLRLLAMRS